MSYKKLHTSVCSTEAQTRVAGALGRGMWKPSRVHTSCTQMVADAVGVPASWVHLTNSCTSALAVAYCLYPKPPTHSIPLLTYSATAAPALLQGLEPEPRDVDDLGWAMTYSTVAVDLWGRACATTDIYSERKERPLILDAAHRFAGEEHAELAEGGTLIAYSFGPQKEVATPQGGALVWRAMENPTIRREVTAFLHYGQVDRVPTGRPGLCGYMPETTAALLCPQVAVRTRQMYKDRRQRILETYENFLGELLITKPEVSSGHLAVIRMPDRGTANLVRNQLRKLGIESGSHYPVSVVHKETNAYELSKRIVSLPCHTQMQPKDAAKIARIVLTA